PPPRARGGAELGLAHRLRGRPPLVQRLQRQPPPAIRADRSACARFWRLRPKNARAPRAIATIRRPQKIAMVLLTPPNGSAISMARPHPIASATTMIANRIR